MKQHQPRTALTRIRALLITMGLVLVGIVGVAGPASASIGTNDYPSSLATAAQDSVVDPWGFYNRECVSFVAWRLNNDNGLAFSNNMNNGHFGFAYQWKQNAINLYGASAYNGTPVAGSVAWWDSNHGYAGAMGHVAYVDSVNANGSINIEEYNYGGTGAYHTRTIATNGDWPSGFLHLKDLGTSAATGSGSGSGGSDVDGNGCNDLAITTDESTGSKAFSLLSTCNTFLAAQQWWNGAGYSWSGITPLVGDVNGDKKADYIFLTNEGASGTKAYVALSTGSGFLAPQLWWNGTSFMYSGIKASLGDVDGNGCKDLVVTTNESTGSKAFVALSTCNTFLAPQQWWNGAGYSWSGITPLVGDVDGNGCADLVITTNEGANGTKAFSLLSTCNTFLTPQQWWNGTGYMYTGIKASLGDVDGNGCNDLVVTTNESTGIKAFSLLSTCNTFLAPQQWLDGVGIGWSGMTPLVGDVNGDKKADYVFLTDEGTNGTKAFVASSSGSGFLAPQLWWNGAGFMYNGIKASLR